MNLDVNLSRSVPLPAKAGDVKASEKSASDCIGGVSRSNPSASYNVNAPALPDAMKTGP